MMLQLCSAAVVAFLLGSLFAWTRTLRRLVAGETIVPWEPARQLSWGLLDLILIGTLLTAGQAFAAERVRNRLGLAANLPFDEWGLEARAELQLAGSLVALLAVVGSVLWLAGRYRIRAADLGVAPSKWRADLRQGCVAFLLVGPIVYGIQGILVQFLESKHPLLELLRENPDPRYFALSGLSAVVVAPVAEEYFFRVLLQGWLERLSAPGKDAIRVLLGGIGATLRTEPIEPQTPADDGSPRDGTDAQEPGSVAVPRPWTPVLVSSLLFALLHSSHGPDPVPLFVLAMVLGGIYQRTQRVLPCVVTHALLNATSLAMLYVGVHLDGGT